MKTEAMFYESLKDKIHCFLCPHNCVIENGHFGKCNVRVHEEGKLFTINYGEVTSASLDPIEKNHSIILNHLAKFFRWEVLVVILFVVFAKIIVFLSM